MKRFGSLIAVALAVAALAGPRGIVAQTPPPAKPAATGVGGTFPEPLYRAWAMAYERETGKVVAYEATGSGPGIERLANGELAFAASDAPMDARDLETRKLAQMPIAIGGVVPVFTLAGVDPGALVLDAATLAKIFAGMIKRWNADEIRALNPALALPDLLVTVIHRSDASGTTNAFTSYLAKAAPSVWTARGTTVDWPVGVGAAGNGGVADAVASTPGAIGYVGYDFAAARTLSYVDLKNADGRVVQPTPASFGAAANHAEWGAPGLVLDLANEPGGASWPISTATYALVQRQPRDAASGAAARDFLRFALLRGAPAAADLGFVPIPDVGIRLALPLLGGTR